MSTHAPTRADAALADSAANRDNGLIQGDKLEHTQWLHMMYPRFILLRELMADDGSIWVTLDDNEAHYAKVLVSQGKVRSFTTSDALNVVRQSVSLDEVNAAAKRLVASGQSVVVITGDVK